MTTRPFYSAWDSRHLGFRCGLVDITAGKRRGELKLPQKASDKDFELIVYKLPSNYLSLAQGLIKKGASLIDIELTFIYPKAKTPRRLRLAGNLKCRFLKRFNEKYFLSLAEDMQFSRFFLDRNIPYEKAVSVWRESLKNHCRGYADKLLVAFYKDDPCGIIALKTKAKGSLSLNIVGVLRKFRNLGIGSRMLDFLISNQAAASDIFVEASSKNIPAQRIYQGAGFKLYDLRFIIHDWKK